MYWTTGFLGLVFALAPFIFGYSGNPVATWTSVVLGITVMLASIIEGAARDRGRWEYWLTGLIGLVGVLAPFVLGFGHIVQAVWTSVVLGVLIAIFAGSRLAIGQFR